MKHRRNTRFRRILIRRIQLIAIALLVGGIFAMSAFLFWAATLKIPDFSLFEARKVSQSTKLYDRTGKVLLYDIHKDVRRTIVPFEAISTYLKNATVAIEDEHFYEHHGIKPKAILRAVLVNLQSGEFSQGGSTITQQVIKNALLSKEKTITRKVKEWILAVKLDKQMSKEAILGLYLNEAPYGGNIYGVEEASIAFFGHRAGEVSLAEAAYLAALPQSPTYLSPYGNNIEQLEARKNLVLKKMRELGSISEKEYADALAEKVKFIPRAEQGIRAPHFVMFVKEELAAMYGEEALDNNGFIVTTTIDLEMQKIAEDTVKKHGEQNEKSFNAKNAALVAINPKNGNILAMVGSRDYFDVEREGNFNVALAKRQPGSSFKPFVYGAAFEFGYTPQTVVFDVPTEFSTACDTLGKPLFGTDESICYMPGNFDEKFRGPIALRDALAQSINIPAVKMLYLTGFKRVIDFAERMGITALGDTSQYGLSLALGGAEVSLLEITSAYGTFANDGVREPYTGILNIKDNTGHTLYEQADRGTRVVDADVVRTLTSVLSDNVARAPEFGSDSYLNFTERKVAVKTGTTNDYRDAWIIGYTPALAVGAWAGNNDNSPMEKKIAGFIVAPMWNEFFRSVFPMIPDEQFPGAPAISKRTKPSLRGVWYGGEIYNIDKISGKLATEYTPPELIEERVVPNPHEILYWVNKNDPTGPVPSNPYNDPQFVHWEVPAQVWIAQHGLPKEAWGHIPSDYDDLHRPDLFPLVRIIEPNATSTYRMTEKLLVDTEIRSTFAIDHVDYFLNDTFLGSSHSMPYAFAFLPQDVGGVSGSNKLRVIAYDVVGNRTEQSISFLVLPH